MTRNKLRLAIVGAGPAGIYAADILLKAERNFDVSIDLFDHLPAPYGLVRYGVAPDHPRIKGIITALREVLDRGDIRIFGKDLVAAYADQIWKQPFWSLRYKTSWLAQTKIFFRWAADSGYVIADPSAGLQLPDAHKRKYPPYLTQSEIIRLLKPRKVAALMEIRER